MFFALIVIKTKKNLLILNPIASHYAFNKFEFRLNQVIKSSKKFNCIYMSVNLLGNESGKTIFEGDTILAIRGKLVSVSERFSLEDYVMNSYSINLKTEIEALKYKSSNKFDEFIDAFNLALSDYYSNTLNTKIDVRVKDTKFQETISC